MEERTMNKIPMKEIWEKLKAPFPQGEIKRHPSTGRAYIPVESIEKRLNETVGMGNWDFLVDSPQICRFGESGRESCIGQALRYYTEGAWDQGKSSVGYFQGVFRKAGCEAD